MIEIAEKKNCTGCTACVAACPKQCITMAEDKEGFLYPKVDASRCINCGLCDKICPVPQGIHGKNEPTAYAAINRHEETRKNSSSGGVFYLLAKRVIERGGVVFGAKFNQDFGVVHGYAQTMEEIPAFMGSKYVQSAIGDSYRQAKEYLDAGKLVLFTGTPCQIGGLRAFLNKEYPNLICQDLACHGVPSPKVWRKYLDFREKTAKAKAESVSFRDKGQGWKTYQMAIRFSNGTRFEEAHTTDMFMTAFLRNLCLRPSCYHCAFKSKFRDADITLADCWGVRKVAPEMDDDCGTSLIFVHSKKGADLMAEIGQNITCVQVDADGAIVYNSAMVRPVEEPSIRGEFIAQAQKRPFDKLIQKYCYPTPNLITRVKIKIRSVLDRLTKR